MSGKLTAWF